MNSELSAKKRYVKFVLNDLILFVCRQKEFGQLVRNRNAQSRGIDYSRLQAAVNGLAHSGQSVT
jgi:hypothetical protein